MRADGAASGIRAGAHAAALAAACLLLACGLVGKDVTIPQDFDAGGPLPTTGAQFPASSLTAPLAASAGDLSKLSSVTLSSATLESTDGDFIDFVSGGTITVSGNGLPIATLATLAAPGRVGLARFAVAAGIDLKPYLAAGSVIDATFTYAPKPVVARGLRLTLVVHASL